MKNLNKEELKKAIPKSLALFSKKTALTFEAQVAFLDKPAVMCAMFTLELMHNDNDSLFGATLTVHTRTVECKNARPDQAGNVDEGSYLPNLAGADMGRLEALRWRVDKNGCTTELPRWFVKDLIEDNVSDYEDNNYRPWDSSMDYGPSYQLFVEYVAPVLSVLYEARGWMPRVGASSLAGCKG